MKFLLLLLLVMFRQDAADKLLEDLDSDDPVVRQTATNMLIDREQDLNRYKGLIWDTSNPEVLWRLKKVIATIESNQKFRSMSTVSPLVTLKFEGTTDALFEKLAAITGQKLDARGFGNNHVKIDCTDSPLFQVLDIACKQIGYDWEVNYRDVKGDVVDYYQTSPMVGVISEIALTGLGMSNLTLGFTGQPFKLQVTETSYSVTNKFGGGIVTQAAISYRYAVDPGLKFAVGPKIHYTKIVTDQGVETINQSYTARYALFTAPPTTRKVSLAGKATFRFPMKIETIELNIDDIYKMKANANEDKFLHFAEYPDITVKLNGSNTLSVHMEGRDNLVKERFTGPYSVQKKNGTVILQKNDTNNNNSGYISVYEDYFQFYIYGTPNSDDAVSIITFEYITEFRDLTFDFAIDNIPLW